MKIKSKWFSSLNCFKTIPIRIPIRCLWNTLPNQPQKIWIEELLSQKKKKKIPQRGVYSCSCWNNCSMFYPKLCETLTNNMIRNKFISKWHHLVMRSWAWAGSHWGFSKPARIILVWHWHQKQRLDISAVCGRFQLINGVLSLVQNPD